mgnify:CR=1 FL=1
MPHHQAFVDWFRHASPYIHAHRGRTFVVTFGGDAVADAAFPNLVHDLAILQGLGIRLVLVHGARPQIEERLRLRGAKLQYIGGLREFPKNLRQQFDKGNRKRLKRMASNDDEGSERGSGPYI